MCQSLWSSENSGTWWPGCPGGNIQEIQMNKKSMNEWMNEWMKKINEWMNEWMNEKTSEKDLSKRLIPDYKWN